MKMKRLLSIGALGLVLACSTSIGALAAERPTNEQIKKDMAAMFFSNKTLLTNYNVNGSTKVGSVVNTSILKTDAKKYEINGVDFTEISKALDLIVPSETINKNAIAILKGTDIEKLLEEVRSVAVMLRECENESHEKKLELEKDIRDLITQTNTALNVKFGKNIDGKITMSVVKGNQIILQLNSGNAYTISKALGDSSDKLTQYAELLNLL